ncbi:hypothetical protein F4778DRAFT_557320 [Xylariomycetidae sp. FL2044]|nr:hypothetical protein F4778DRAFT_557320 [Xylariomycetidae sp. FL2044]
MPPQSGATGARFNLKPREWRIIFQELDRLKGEKKTARVVLFGQVLSEHRLRRARRYERTVPSSANDTLARDSPTAGNLQRVTIEVEHRGDWTLHKDFGCATGQSRIQFTIDDRQHDLMSASQEQIVSDPLSMLDPFVLSSPRGYLGPIQGNMLLPASDALVHYTAPQTVGFPVTHDFMQSTSLDISLPRLEPSGVNSYWPSSVSPGLPQSINLLGNLPSAQIEKNLQLHGVNLNSLTSANPTRMGNGDERSSPAEIFLENVASMLVSRYPNSEQTSTSNAFAASFRNLAINQANRNLEYGTLLGPDEILRVDFNRILLVSVVNGYAGMQSLPLDSIITYLGRFGDIGPILTQLLTPNSGLMGQSLAENLFRAAIEAGNEPALKRILATQMVDVNNVICTYRGRRYTPIERASSLRSFNIILLLLGANADVNKSYSDQTDTASALAYLLSPLPRLVNSEVLEIANMLVQAGAKVGTYALEKSWSLDSRLTLLLAPRAIIDNHSQILSSNALASMAKPLTDDQITHVVNTWFQVCEDSNCGKCLERYGERLEWLLIQAAVFGHYHLVQILLQKHRPILPHRFLSAAIRGKHDAIIELALGFEPDLDGPPHSIDVEYWEYSDPHSWRSITTCFSEAIRAENASLRGKIEEAGAMSNLNKERRLEPAVAAAAKIRDFPLVQQLTQLCKVDFSSPLSKALTESLDDDMVDEDILEVLFEAGADCTDPQLVNDVLCRALASRSLRVARAVLESNLMIPSTEESLLRAIRWGDPEIIAQVRQVCPRACLGSHNALDDIVEQRDKTSFKYAQSNRLIGPDALAGAMHKAVQMKNMEMLEVLLSMGAIPDSASIEIAMSVRSSDILGKLLSHLQHDKDRVPRGFGTQALITGLRQGSKCFQLVNTLIGTHLIDLWSLQESDSPCNQHVSYRMGGDMLGIDILTPFGVALEEGRADVIKKLIEAGCDVNATVAVGPPYLSFTALLWAVKAVNCEMVQFLVENGARVNAEAKFRARRTPLQQAAEVGNLEIVKLLISKGADVNAAPAKRGGGTAIQLAAISGNCDVAAELLACGARLDNPPSKFDGRWPLEGAAEHGRFDMIYLLFEAAQQQGIVFDSDLCRNAAKLARENGYLACASYVEELEKERNGQVFNMEEWINA